MTYNEQDLRELSDSVAARLSEKRFLHTKGVEQEIERLALIYLPEKITELRAAALLHDLAKELPIEEQIAICRENGDPELDTAVRSPAILHGHAAAYLIPKYYPKYALPEIISAIYKHTTGAERMSTFDKLLFFADFIEPNRPWQYCRKAREKFYAGMPDDPSARSVHLDLSILSVLAFTLRYLKEKGTEPDPTTERAAAALKKQYPNHTVEIQGETE